MLQNKYVRYNYIGKRTRPTNEVVIQTKDDRVRQ